jgi:hypothetical protein
MSSVFVAETTTVYRVPGHRRYLSKQAAIRAYAKGKIRAKRPCECENGSYEDGYSGYDCGCQAHIERVLPRYLRLIRRRLRAGVK